MNPQGTRDGSGLYGLGSLLIYFPVPSSGGIYAFRHGILVTAEYDAPGVFGLDLLGYYRYCVLSSYIHLCIQSSVLLYR